MTSEPPGDGAVLRPAVVVAGGLALLALRLWHLRAAPFVYDEPIFLDAARHQLESGEWLSASPITGSRGVRYGPSVFWLYGGVQWVLGAKAITAIATLCVLTTASQAFLVAGLTRLARGGWVFFLVLLGLVGSSPYLDFWSRLAWDQTVLVCSAAVIGILCRATVVGVWHGAAVGLLLGIALSSHPMTVPLAVAVVATVGWELRHRGRDALRVGASFLGATLTVSLPYLHYLATQGGRGGPPVADSFTEPLVERILQAPIVLSAARIEYLFDYRVDRFVDSTTGMSAVLGLRGVVLLVVTLGAIVGLASAWRDPDPRRQRVGRCAVLTWISSVTYFAAAGVAQEPHYQFVAWWVIPVGLALAVRPVCSIERRGQSVVVAGAAIVILLNVAFVAGWRAYIAADHGTRGVFYGASLGNQQDVVDELCQRSGTALLVANETAVFPESIEYVISTTSACREHRIEICRAPCDPDPKREAVRLVYAPDGSAKLVVVFEDH